MSLQTKLNFNYMNAFRVFFLIVFFTFYNCLEAQAQQKKFVVVLDAGHGGKDPGKVHKHMKEKEIALKLTLKIGKLLSKNKKVKVIYTRKTDRFIGLYERGKIANKADADLFVSIHCNAHHTSAYGSETWVLGTHVNDKNFEVVKAENQVILMEDNYEEKYKGFDPNSPESVIGLTLLQEDYLDQSIQLASMIQNDFKKLRRKNRGVKQAGFIVLHQTYMPSVLIEAGFLTNRSEGKFLSSNYGQNKIAASVSKSILKYIKQLNANSIERTVTQTQKNTKPKKQPKIGNVVFKIQIAAGRKMSTAHYNFKGLRNVKREKNGNLYRYYYENTNNYSKAKQSLKIVQKKGYKSAFIVAFRNGKKVPLSEVFEK